MENVKKMLHKITFVSEFRGNGLIGSAAHRRHVYCSKIGVPLHHFMQSATIPLLEPSASSYPAPLFDCVWSSARVSFSNPRIPVSSGLNLEAMPQSLQATSSRALWRLQ